MYNRYAMRIYLRKKKYDLVRSKLKNNWGDCSDPNKPNRKIRISDEIPNESQRLLDVVIHEMMHSIWDLDEEVVDQVSSDMARILYQMGARVSLD